MNSFASCVSFAFHVFRSPIFINNSFNTSSRNKYNTSSRNKYNTGFRSRFNLSFRFLISCITILVLIGAPAIGTCQAKKAEQLTVYGVISYAQKVARVFRKESGIKVRFISMNGSGATLERIKSEKSKPRGMFGLVAALVPMPKLPMKD